MPSSQYMVLCTSPKADSLDVGIQRSDIVSVSNIDLFRDLFPSFDDL